MPLSVQDLHTELSALPTITLENLKNQDKLNLYLNLISALWADVTIKEIITKSYNTPDIVGKLP